MQTTRPTASDTTAQAKPVLQWRWLLDRETRLGLGKAMSAMAMKHSRTLQSLCHACYIWQQPLQNDLAKSS